MVPDVVWQSLDPVTAALLVVLFRYLQAMRKEISDDLDRLRARIRRLEGEHIPDGGAVLEDDQSRTGSDSGG